MFQLERFCGAEDFELFSKLVFDPAVMEMNMGRIFTEEEASWFYQMISAPDGDQGDFGYFKVLLSETQVFIGVCAMQKNEEYAASEIEYMLLPAYWNQGYGSALVTHLLERARSVSGTERAMAITAPDNRYSRRILLKHGFVSEKTYTNPDGELAELFLKEKGES